MEPRLRGLFLIFGVLRYGLVLVVAACFLACGGGGDSEDTRLDLAPDETVRTEMQAARLPGVALGVVGSRGLVWARGYGWADLEAETPTTPGTSYLVSSLSKSVTVAALMRLWEEGHFRLDDDVGDYLPFPVRNPAHPTAPLTFRALVGHTSSVFDDWRALGQTCGPDESVQPLEPFLTTYLKRDPVEGAKVHFRSWEPGSSYEYSNVGIALVGLLIEGLTGGPFANYCAETIFEPLGMTETAWRLSEVEADIVALPYTSTPEGHTPVEPYECAYYPAVGLRTSVGDFARFLAAFLNYGEFQGVRILEQQTVRMMLSNRRPGATIGQGMGWQMWRRSGRTLIGHLGLHDGASALAFFDPNREVGVVAFTNAGKYPWIAEQTALWNMALELYHSALGEGSPRAAVRQHLRVGGGTSGGR